MTNAVIFDIDGTLANIDHRLHHLYGGSPDRWTAFFSAMDDDAIVEPIRELLWCVRDAGKKVVLCSGRPDNYREKTEKWLAVNGVEYDALYMRQEGDTRADHVVKAQLLRELREDGYDPFIVVDDRQSVVDMWRDSGLTCLQCAPMDRTIPETAVLTLMIGPSGAGKSTWLSGRVAHCEFGIHPSHVLSSDQIRHDLCGDFRDQSRNNDVFAALHAQALARLKHGLPVVIDATHLRRKDRIAAATLVPATNLVRYVVIDRDECDKRRDAGWRDHVGFDLIAKHEQTFRSQIADILAGDGLPNVTVFDLRACDAACHVGGDASRG